MNYKLVYQGGHHNVYCNGRTHYKMTGGYRQLQEEKSIGKKYKCDCKMWAEFNEMLTKPKRSI